jgi:hypothetical protein
MSAGIEKPSFSSGLAIANGGLSCSLFWFGQPVLGKTNRPPSLDFCVLALDIAGFTEPRRNITKGAA